MSNFEFLYKGFPSIFSKLKTAEQRVFTEPTSAAHYARLALEESIHILFKEEHLDLPYDTGIANLIRTAFMENRIPSQYKEDLSIVRKVGNTGAHYGRNVKGKEALMAIKYLFGFLQWFAEIYADEAPEHPGPFDQSIIPKVGAERAKLKELQAQAEAEQARLNDELEAAKQNLKEEQEKAAQSTLALEALRQKQEQDRAALAEKKKHAKTPSEYNEAQTRLHLIDLTLKEAGWSDLLPNRGLEFPVTGMPRTKDNPRGNGYVDYVLWGDDGLPLALVEAKRTSAQAEQGRHQASLYADCLENIYGRRPVIYYTNGYHTYLWDDTFYSQSRRVHGFYTKDELEWLMQRRSTRKDIRKPDINRDITGRPYQIEAIQRVMESFVTTEVQTGQIRGAKRSALLVMATGSGKTRTAASIVDVLMKNNWIKRVLFLADRNALVSQAKRAFAEHLPDLSSIDLTQEKENNTTRLVFSTYQSIINKIDGVKTEDGRFYGAGHFDLIVVDEAHRSVYNKYGIIFEYFDSLLLGLTATPKSHVDHNTYELFDCTDGNPTFAYELDDAVNNGFLVPYQNMSLSTTFLQQGIKYSELSEEDKAKYEEEFRDNATGLFPEHIGQSALNKWLFNIDTVNKILDALMENGLKIEGGDKLGRTIIFAANQHHADFIQQCFEARYPQYPPGFMAVIHNKVSHGQSLIDKFCDHHKENLPQIAVSVDMMDTGIDAPRVLNLVFFKVVRSYSKFWQMIGRGTRLCLDVFGPTRPKESFLIFDACQNFEFFEENKRGVEGRGQLSITQQIFITRLAVARLLMETGDPEDLQLSSNMLDMLHQSIQMLDKERFDVKMKQEYVDEFVDRARWNHLDPDSIQKIERHLSKLPSPESINEKARRFDLMMLKMMQANLLLLDSERTYQDNLIAIAEQLSKKFAIPQVERSKAMILALQDPEFYKGLRQQKMEEVRQEIRELVQYLESSKQELTYLDLADSDLTISAGKDHQATPQTGELYRKQVERFIRENKHHVTISKLNTNQPITEYEIKELQNILFDDGDRGTYMTYKEVFGDQPFGVFIRSIVGLDIGAAQEAFSDFLKAGNLTADQMNFVNTIIQHLNRNGTIDKRLLFESPFNDKHEEGLFGIFDDGQAAQIINLIDRINGNADIG